MTSGEEPSSVPHREVALDIDPLVIERNRRQRESHLQKIEIPFMRWVGWNLVSLGVLLHNLFVVPAFSVETWVAVTLLAELYCAASWIILYFFYDRAKPFDLGLLFLVLDIPLWIAALVAAGGVRSWLFFILFMRVADQVNTSFRRAMVFAHLVTLSYAVMVVFLIIRGDVLNLADAVSKCVFIYGGSLYIAMSAKGSSDRRIRTSRVIRIARNLVRTLEEQTRELKVMSRKAEESSRAKSSFLANVSHEIRTPLNSILGMSQLALTSELPPQQREQMETIRGSAKTLLAVIEDILDFSKIEALKMDLEEVPFSIRETLFDALKALGYEAYSKGLELAGYIDPAVPDRLSGDPVRIRQIILNLVGNAIKFTDEGSVIVGMTLEEHRNREVVLHLRVNDSGPGIPDGQLDSIFEPFSHTNPSMARNRGGTGLGLSICARLAGLMRGRIWAESNRGEGSSFHCTFTVRLKAEVNPPPRLLSWRTLVGDANDCSREFIAATMETWGAVVDTSNRPEGMLAELARDSSRFDSVVIDSDWFYSDSAKVQTALALITPVTRVSAILPHPGDFRTANHCRSLGCNHFISRPVSEEEILEACKPEDKAGAVSSPVMVSTGDPLEILVVDDDRINQEVTGGLLRRLGHQVTILGSGNVALELLARRTFDLLLFDVEMPGMDGFELTRRVRALEPESGRRTPIAAVTAHALRGDRERCLAAGMDDYLTKPIELEALASLVRRHGGSAPHGETFARSDGSRLQKRLARLFLDKSPEMLDRITRAVEKSDAAELAAAAHTIKGSAMNFDAADVVEAAASIETMARDGSISEARDSLPALTAALDRLRGTLLRNAGEEVSSA